MIPRIDDALPAHALDPFRKLPGHTRTAPGLERRLWRRLPAILLWGSALPLGFALLRLWSVGPDDEAAAQLQAYVALGVLLLHWTLVLTVAFGCVIVMVMKGPAYVADAYPFPERDASRGG
ncbi:conserved hypothetical protein [Rubrivivax sp. A210]|uniref:hypothetical protein n=1 Tax=Rubrivivax sp. A210 TaxID=2772301 RepID=UPI00191A9EB2|nr:hypothetical protein [Rubrivivax sp. A210]CAD5370217.1 conserved hypothetical protein [Rubrivivax sp. A210]